MIGIYIDITDYCNSKCPLCTRHKVSKFTDVVDLTPTSFVNRSSVSIETWKNWFTPEVLEKISFIDFQGSFGEPSLCEDLLDIIKYSKSINKSIDIFMSTNGGTRDKLFWKTLGRVFFFSGSNSRVIFSIDGLEDTLSEYRVGVDYKKVIDNARSFISGGGNAEWRMLVFKHNEHQIEECRKLSKDFGFKKFSHQTVNGFWDTSGSGNGSYTYTHNGKLKTLYEASDRKFTTNPGKSKVNSDIHCEFNHKIGTVGNLRIDSVGIVHACCYHQSRLRYFYPDYYINNNPDAKPVFDESIDNPNVGSGVKYLQKIFYDSIIPLIEDQGGLKSINLNYFSLDEIINTPFFQHTLISSWKNSTHMCRESCGIYRIK